MEEQARIRCALADLKIDYLIKTVNQSCGSACTGGVRARMGTLGEKSELMYEYIIYVKKADYSAACRAISS